MPTYTTLITAEELDGLRFQRVAPAVLDCRFDLADTESGEAAFAQGHLPDAQYLHLSRDLSGTKNGLNGRHPLPEREALAGRLRLLGVQRGQQVVVYDDQGGIFAARAWWLLRWLGHAKVAVLDGGLTAWQSAGRPVETGTATPPRGDFASTIPLVGTTNRAALLDNLKKQGPLVIVDARSADRFQGENETLDARAGHIPGARNRFYRRNLGDDGLFKPATRLREEFQTLLGQTDAREAVQQCGSGVTACHNLLAMEVAGMSGALLYPGSWSEWSSDPLAPIETAV